MLNKKDFDRFKNESPEIKEFLLKNLLTDILNIYLIPLEENIIKDITIEKGINKENIDLKKLNKEKQIQIKNTIAEVKSLIEFVSSDK